MSLSYSLSRRRFLQLGGALVGSLALGGRMGWRSAADPSPRVVHVYSPRATHWDFSKTWFGDYVDQAVVDEMVDLGVTQLTGTNSREAAWRALLPDYEPGQRVAIKVNFNNAATTDDHDNFIDALVEPVNAVIRGLVEIGVPPEDIWVYDAIRAIPDRFRNRCAFPGVQFSGGQAGPNPLGFNVLEFVTFDPPPGIEAPGVQRISNALAWAHYVINMPIMKKHFYAGVTLSFKNHFGSIHDCAALHDYVFLESDVFTPDYSPLVDIYRNKHFGPKTVLVVGDGLFGSQIGELATPKPWVTFGNDAPNSLFFSRDPVAIDCVMYDFIAAETDVPPGADVYLALAAQAGLGVFEHRDPAATDRREWYRSIEYVYLDLDRLMTFQAHCQGQTAYLEWSRPPHANLAGYRVYYTSETGGPANEGPSPLDVPDPDQEHLTLTGLTLYAIYELWMEPYDEGGDPLLTTERAVVMPSDHVIHLPLVL